ncbi:hypothetical protein ANN_19978 [Periplaneta americana]|uniref:Uncharacterized protein n=1 Tax=Periplaneta americana TaxID=6978 RepID=A0ABQ8SBD1_PERAM|nr:hypothetical protein ANN_19978 [Periplaneta americana]
MAGLCEGGNEPPGSLKSYNYNERQRMTKFRNKLRSMAKQHEFVEGLEVECRRIPDSRSASFGLQPVPRSSVMLEDHARLYSQGYLLQQQICLQTISEEQHLLFLRS